MVCKGFEPLSSMRALALVYAQNGVAVFPCREANSTSGAAKAPYVDGGMHRSTKDVQQIEIWWQRWPNAVPGLPCCLNEIIAIDADRHGREDGVASLFNLFAAYNLSWDAAPQVQTPRQGVHYLFLRPSALGDTIARIGPAMDVRDNAYVIAAGSVMASGLRYALRNGSVEMLAAAVGSRTIPELPEWLAIMISKPAIALSRKFESWNDAGRSIAHIQGRLKGLVRTAALAAPGQRNATLHWAACRAGELVQEGLIAEEAALALLAEAGTYAGLPLRETMATVKSGIASARGSLRRG